MPAELADPKTRRERLRAAKRELEAEWAAERRAREEMLARRAEHRQRTGRNPSGRRPTKPIPESSQGRLNLTDRDSRPQRTARGFIQGYNAQAVATEDQIIMAADVIKHSSDGGLLAPMTVAASETLAAAGADAPVVVLADAGYWSAPDIDELTSQGIMALVPPDTGTATKRPRRGGLYDQMRAGLDSEDGRRLYRRRQIMIEPVIGHTKHNRRLERFRRRGLGACHTEWRLITATHNLLKLWTATPTIASSDPGSHTARAETVDPPRQRRLRPKPPHYATASCRGQKASMNAG